MLRTVVVPLAVLVVGLILDGLGLKVALYPALLALLWLVLVSANRWPL